MDLEVESETNHLWKSGVLKASSGNTAKLTEKSPLLSSQSEIALNNPGCTKGLRFRGA